MLEPPYTWLPTHQYILPALPPDFSLNPTTSLHFCLCRSNPGPGSLHHLLHGLLWCLPIDLSYFPFVFLYSSLHLTMWITFLNSKSDPVNTPVNAHCIQNKTQTVTSSMGLPQLTCPVASLSTCPLPQDIPATLTFFLTTEQASLIPVYGPSHLLFFLLGAFFPSLWTAASSYH